MNLDSNDVTTFNLDHLGIVAGVCRELNIAQRIDDLIDKRDPRRIISCGKAVVAMIINGLGFAGRTLYMTPKFFENKPVQRLFGEDVTAEDFNENALGKALDEIAEFGPIHLFAHTALGIAMEHNLMGNSRHLDSTTISMEGEYTSSLKNLKESALAAAKAEPHETEIKIVHGFAKQRPDLKQFVLQMAVSGPAELPFWHETLEGNNSDKSSFPDTIERVEAFKKELKEGSKCKWIADSALYTEANILRLKEVLWISRVPETIASAKNLLELDHDEINWNETGDGLLTACINLFICDKIYSNE